VVMAASLLLLLFQGELQIESEILVNWRPQLAPQTPSPLAAGAAVFAQAPTPAAESAGCYGTANYTAADCPGGSCYAGQPNGCGSRSLSVISADIVPDQWPGG
jgi:hypothetical protein